MKNVGVNVTPLACALVSSAVDAGLRACAPRPHRVGEGNAEIAGDGGDVVLGEHLRTAHQRDMRFPELVGVLGVLDEHGGAAGEAVIAHRAVAEDVAQPLAELVADLGDALVGGTAIGAGIAAVLDQRDRRCLGSEGVVRRPYGAVEPVAVACFRRRHPGLVCQLATVQGSISQKVHMPRARGQAAASARAWR